MQGYGGSDPVWFLGRGPWDAFLAVPFSRFGSEKANGMSVSECHPCR
jgi:hypothetical protein